MIEWKEKTHWIGFTKGCTREANSEEQYHQNHPSRTSSKSNMCKWFPEYKTVLKQNTSECQLSVLYCLHFNFFLYLFVWLFVCFFACFLFVSFWMSVTLRFIVYIFGLFCLFVCFSLMMVMLNASGVQCFWMSVTLRFIVQPNSFRFVQLYCPTKRPTLNVTL